MIRNCLVIALTVFLVSCSSTTDPQPEAGTDLPTTVNKEAGSDIPTVNKEAGSDLPLVNNEAGSDLPVIDQNLTADHMWSDLPIDCKGYGKLEAIKWARYITNTSLPAAASATQVEDFMPGASSIPGWVIDGTLQSGYTTLDIENLINGSHDPYRDEGCDGFAMNSYKSDLPSVVGCMLEMDLKLWDMETTAKATTMFNYKKNEAINDFGLVFDPPITNAVDECIIADNNPYWTVHCRKGEYVLYFNVQPKSS